MSTNKLTWRVMSLLLIADGLEFVLLMSAKKLAPLFMINSFVPFSVQKLTVLGQALVGSILFWTCVASMGASFIVWMSVLALVDLSLAFPLGSLSFLVIPFLSAVFLHEHIPPERWIGFVFIVAGIIALSGGEKRQKEAS